MGRRQKGSQEGRLKIKVHGNRWLRETTAYDPTTPYQE
jgi:hypothetical protein